jgi:hypothetical protein
VTVSLTVSLVNDVAFIHKLVFAHFAQSSFSNCGLNTSEPNSGFPTSNDDLGVLFSRLIKQSLFVPESIVLRVYGTSGLSRHVVRRDPDVSEDRVIVICPDLRTVKPRRPYSKM